MYVIYNTTTNEIHMTVDDTTSRDDNVVTGYSWLETDLDLPAWELKIENGAVVEDTAATLSRREQDARDERDELLAATDWGALSDSPTMSTAMQNYRQALRDVPSQSGFPDNITWPTKP